MDLLIELSKSPNEMTALQAVRELLDRLLGKPSVVIDSSHTQIDIDQMYLAALRQANEPKTVVATTLPSSDGAGNE
jgi:hypothetical protein